MLCCGVGTSTIRRVQVVGLPCKRVAQVVAVKVVRRFGLVHPKELVFGVVRLCVKIFPHATVTKVHRFIAIRTVLALPPRAQYRLYPTPVTLQSQQIMSDCGTGLCLCGGCRWGGVELVRCVCVCVCVCCVCVMERSPTWYPSCRATGESWAGCFTITSLSFFFFPCFRFCFALFAFSFSSVSFPSSSSSDIYTGGGT